VTEEKQSGLSNQKISKVKKVFSRLFELVSFRHKNVDVENEALLQHEAKSEMDKQLVLSLTGKKRSKLPAWKQLKRVGSIFSEKERMAVKALLFFVVLAVMFLFVNFWFFTLKVKPDYGGEYSEGLLGYPKYLNPILAPANDVDSDVSSLIYSSLMRYGKNGIESDLVESYQISEDQKEYVFVLKKGIKWHDGEELGVDDVLMTFDLIRDPDSGSPLFKTFSGVTAERIDDYTVKFILKEPFAPFLSTLTFGILPEKYWAEIDPANIKLAELNLKPIGSGAWKFESLKKDKQGNIKSVTLAAFDGYYAGRPYMDKVVFKFYPDVLSLEQALRNKNVSAISYLPRTNRDKFFGDQDEAKGWRQKLLAAAQYTAIFFNPDNNDLLKDRNVRQALYKAIDRQRIVRQVLEGEADIVNGPILPGWIGYNSDIKIDYAPAQATSLLDQNKWVGITPNDYIALVKEQEKKSLPADAPELQKTDEERLAELSGQEYFRKKDGRILEINLTVADQPESVAVAKLVQEDWQRIGVKTNLITVSAQNVRREVIKPRNYQTLLYGEITGYDPDPYPFWHSSQQTDPGLSLSMITDRRIDKFLEDARQTNDQAVREDNYKKLQQLLLDETIAIFLYQPKYPYIVSDKVYGLVVDKIAMPQDRLADMGLRYFNTKRLGN
jgi:peptide/nickel transport system substrate-binding protein